MKLRKRPFSICTVLVSLCMLWLYAFLIVCHCEARQKPLDPGGGFILEPVTVTTKKKVFPIIFLPGVAGTRLYAGRQELWPLPAYPTSRDLKAIIRREMRRLFMNEGGKPLEEGIKPKDIIRHADTRLPEFWLNVPIYDPFVKRIQTRYEDGRNSWNYKEDRNFFVWGYDWRLDNTDHLTALYEFIKNTKLKTQSEKVILIGHSLGGLIARAYAVKNPEDVAMLISIGSPFAGSPKPFYGLVMGYTFGNTVANPEDMKALFQNTPSVFQLLPQYDFVTDARSGSRIIPNSEFFQKIKYPKEVNRTKWINPLVGVFASAPIRSINETLLRNAKQFYDIVGTSFDPKPLDSSVKHYVVIGKGVRTLQGYKMIQSQESSVEYDGVSVVLEPIWGDGDGTVPLKSAEIQGAYRTYHIDHYNPSFLSAEHGALPSNKAVQEVITKFFLSGWAPNNENVLGIIKDILATDSGLGSQKPTEPFDAEADKDFTLK